MKKYYFISGLHRSGSTLLSALLNQNPKFHSGSISPVLPIINNTEKFISNNECYISSPKPLQVHKIISSLIDQYHDDNQEEVVFDKNRMWPDYINYIEGYIKQKAKIICPVRNIDEILVSFLKLIHNNENKEFFNPIDKEVIENDLPLNDYSRCKILLSPEWNLILAINAMKNAVDNNLRDRLLFVEYKDIVLNPASTFNIIYNFLGEDYYEHNFKTIKSKNEVKDAEFYNLKGLHDVREELKITSDNPKDYLTKDIIDECEQLQFWRNL